MNFSKLTLAPWETSYHKLDDPQPCLVNGDRCVLYAPYIPSGADEQAKADLAFAALARNAFDVMVRRKWWASYDAEIGWIVSGENGRWLRRTASYGTWFASADPFTALIEADMWMTQREQANG